MSQDYDAHILLHHLDDPFRVLMWTIDEALLLIIPPFIGLMTDQLFLWLVLGFGSFAALRKAKKKFGGGTLKHAFYWYLPHNKARLKKTPPSYIRHYRG
jgi:conjugal transfer pilus assembly protein TraL